MKRFAIFGMAAALAGGLAVQADAGGRASAPAPRGAAPARNWGSMPNYRLNMPTQPRAGVSWSGRPQPSGNQGVWQQPRPGNWNGGQAGSWQGPRPGGNQPGQWHGGGQNGRAQSGSQSHSNSQSNSNSHAYSNSHSYSTGQWHGGGQSHGGGNAHGGGQWGGGGQWHGGYARVGRGYVLPSFWLNPGYTVWDWSGYGLGQPSYGRHWVRYYDDALLIDDRGTVYDTVNGVNWGGEGEESYAYAPPPSDAGVSPDYDEGYEDGYDDGYDAAFDADGVTYGSRLPARPAAGGGYAWGASSYYAQAPVAYAQPAVTIIQAPPTVTTTTTTYVEEEVVYRKPAVRRAAAPKRRWKAPTRKLCCCVCR